MVKEDGLIEGRPASEALDMMIIPGGSLVESQTLSGKLAKEITKMADSGKFVLGICSGFQILSKKTDIGRLSATPIMRQGLGLIDAEFLPLICTDLVKATIVAPSNLTDAVGVEVKGFHCHTYGNVVVGKGTKPILLSHAKRLNYHSDPRDLVAGVANTEGNVVGIIVHALLDQNPIIIDGIIGSLGIKSQELAEIKAVNAKLTGRIRTEVGVSTGIHAVAKSPKTGTAKALLITALGSGSGKTFIVTGLASALKKKGLAVDVVKIGGDIRDLVPALYMIKEPIKGYSSIKIGESGWKQPFDAIRKASREYGFIIIEGAMSAFTGLFMNHAEGPTSTAEVAAALGVPTVVVGECDNEGIEGALASSLNYVSLLRKLGVNVAGVILNKVRVSYLTSEIRQFIQSVYSNAGVELLGIVPRVNLEGRGAIPEIEIKYEEFGAKALEVAETSLELDRIVRAATPAYVKELDYAALVEKFKVLLTEDFGVDVSKDANHKGCLKMKD